MTRFEIKKMFGTFGSRVAVVLLACVVAVSCYLAIGGVEWINEQGDPETGFAAIQKLRKAQEQWKGELNKEKLQTVIQELQRISATPEAQSRDYNQNDIAYGWKQGFMPIRDMMNYAYAPNFNTFDYFIADSVRPEQAGAFYTNRTKLLKEFLYTGDGKNAFSPAEKAFLVEQYEQIETPFSYTYKEGWSQLLQNSPTVIMIAALILGYLVAGIFSNEFRWKSDAIFFTTVHGRNSGTAAKIKAGFLVVTGLYWSAVGVYALVTLGILGFGGGNCPIQMNMWKCLYNLTYWQTWLLVVIGGYIGNLFFAFLTMWVSAKTRSSLFAVTVPFLLIFIPTVLDNMDVEWISKMVGLFPDQLLQISQVMRYFRVYTFGKTVLSAMTILTPLYFLLTAVLVPLMYREFRTKQIG